MAAKNRNTFEKLQREMQKKRKAETKRERRRAKKDESKLGTAGGETASSEEAKSEGLE